jgi:hypothetical protein
VVLYPGICLPWGVLSHHQVLTLLPRGWNGRCWYWLLPKHLPETLCEWRAWSSVTWKRPRNSMRMEGPGLDWVFIKWHCLLPGPPLQRVARYQLIAANSRTPRGLGHPGGRLGARRLRCSHIAPQREAIPTLVRRRFDPNYR